MNPILSSSVAEPQVIASPTRYPFFSTMKKGISLITLFFSTFVSLSAAEIKVNKKVIQCPSTNTVIPARTQELPIPSDGDCLYKSIIVGYLLPTADDADLFKTRLAMLVGEDKVICTEETKYDQNDEYKDDSNMNNSKTWDSARLRSTFSALRLTSLLYSLRENYTFSALVHDIKQHIGIKNKVWGGTKEIQTMANHLQVTIQEYTPNPDNINKLTEPDCFVPQNKNSIMSISIVRDNPTTEEAVDFFADKDMQLAQAASTQDSQHRQHYRALLPTIPSFLQRKGSLSISSFNTLTLFQSKSLDNLNKVNSSTDIQYMEEQTKAFTYAKMIKKGVDETNRGLIFKGVQLLNKVKISRISNPKPIMEKLLNVLTSTAISWESYGTKRIIAKTMRRFVYSMYLVGQKDNKYIDTEYKYYLLDCIKKARDLINESKTPSNGLRFELDVVETMLRVMLDSTSTANKWADSVMTTIESVKEKDPRKLFGVMQRIYKDFKAKLAKSWYEVVLYIDYMKEEAAKNIKVLRQLQYLLYFYKQPRSEVIQEEPQTLQGTSNKNKKKTKKKYTKTKQGGNWHILYAGIEALTYVIQHAQGNEEAVNQIIKAAVESKSKKQPGLAYYFSFNKIKKLGIKVNNWRIREKAIESALLLKNHPNEYVQEKAREFLKNYGDNEKDERAKLLYKSPDVLIATKNALQKDWRQYKAGTDKILEEQLNNIIQVVKENQKIMQENQKMLLSFKKKQKSPNNNLIVNNKFNQDHTKEKAINPKHLSSLSMENDLMAIAPKTKKNESIFLVVVLTNQPIYQNPSKHFLFNRFYKKYICTTQNLDGEAQQVVKKLQYNFTQTAKSAHIIVALLQCMEKVSAQYIYDLAISAPICPKCKYLLTTIIGYTNYVKVHEKGCRGAAFQWPMPSFAMRYLNRFVLNSGQPFRITQIILDKFLGISQPAYQALQIESNNIKNRLEHTQEDLKIANNKNSNLINQLNKQDNTIESNKKIINQTKAKLKDKDNEFNKLQLQFDNKKRLLDQIQIESQKTQQLVQELTKQLKQKDNELNNLKDQIKKKTEEAQRLTNQLSEKEIELNNTTKILDSTEENLKIANNKNSNLVNQFNSAEWLIEHTQINIEAKGEDQKNPFLYAAQEGNLDALKLLKNKGANVNSTDKDGNNALHLAINNNVDFEIIEWLVIHTQIDLDAKGYNQKTPFLMAAEKGNLNALKMLKNNGANVHATDIHGNNALHLAAIFAPNGKGIEWLIDSAKIDIESKNNNQNTPFIKAAEKGNLDALKMLKNNGANLKATNKHGNNALHYAIMYAPNGKGIQWLIDTAKIPIESKTGGDQYTPFIWAAKQGNLDALKMLKNKGANLNATDKHGNNALHWAAMYAPNGKGIEWLIDTAHINIESKMGSIQYTPFLRAAEKGNLDALKILKNKGANVNATDKHGNNVLHLAAMFAPNGKGIQWLIDTVKIDIESKGFEQRTPFLRAAEKGNLDALKMLKNKGANVHATDKHGNNALHFAAMFAPNGKGIEWLIDSAKIDIESKGNYQATPFLMAAEEGNLNALKILKNKGANVNATDKYGDNALHYAALFAPNGKSIEWLIDTAKIDIESKGQYQMTPFLRAAEKGNLDALKILKNKGSNVNATDIHGNNALHFAAMYAPNGKGIEWLIDTAKIDIESKGFEQRTPFLRAAEKGNLDALKMLKNKGANVHATDKHGNNALHFAAMFAPNGKGIEWLIDSAKIDIESKNNNQSTPFIKATEKGNLDALKILKNNGAKVDATNQYGNNALHWAAMYAPNGKGIEWLIDSAKIDIESKGFEQRTPFLKAAEKGNLDALKMLKNNGANLKATDKHGNNALHYAVMYAPNGKGIEWLIDTAKIPIESKGFEQRTPFIWAAKQGNLDALKMLKNKGANLNATDKHGNNALHWAAMYALNGKGIEWLIDTAHINIESKTGGNQYTPFIWAAEKGNLDALKVLKKNGANVHATDKDGNNALHFAAMSAPNGKGIEWLIDTAKIDIESKTGGVQNTPFLWAAEKGNLDALKMLKNNGANVNATNKHGNNALHYAVMFAPNGKGIEWLIDSAKIDIESKNNTQSTPFIKAAQKGNLDALKMLKNKGANVHATDKHGDNALHYAAMFAPSGKGIEWLIDSAKIDIESKGQYQITSFLIAANKGNLDALKMLKNKGANLNATDQDGNNALHFAAMFAPNGKGIEWLIDTAKIPIESKGFEQRTPFIWAAEKGNLDALKILKNKGANVNATDIHGNNALHLASMFAPNGKSIQWLIDSAKIDIESKNNNQSTPFISAAQNGNLDALKILKNKGANLNATDKYEHNALHYAAIFAPNGKGIEWLIDTAKIPIESKTGGGDHTPFLRAAQKGNLDALKILKNRGANVNATDKYGDNALHYAVMFAPNGKGIEWLIDTAKIDIESKGFEQRTPFIWAAKKGNLDALKILKNNGANVNATNKYDKNALYYAKKYSNSQETIDWLQDVCGLT